ncbi:patatin family protein [Evansella sp. AB-rgal1]|uniref:patatin-like phospholipase family protein n=1 Tax=Evansella sp. AB-rgal1 TaxID=3242696 RepID=UPI00359D0AC7
MQQCGLVLEGGGMRGLYTAGVLEFFLQKNLFFPYVIGVSAGACMAASYLSKQKGRNKQVNIGLANDPRYLSYRNFLLKRELFGMDFLFHEIPNNVIPFDFDTFYSGEEQFWIGTTDCETGEPMYFSKHSIGEDILTIIRASSSIPFIAPAVQYNGKQLLDGGIADPIPIKKAQQDGFKKNIVIMPKRGVFQTRSKLAFLYKYFVKKHPSIAKVLENSYNIYNETLHYIHQEEKKGNILLIQPSVDLPVSSMERNQKRLTQLYDLGYEDAQKRYHTIYQWLQS